MSSVSVRNTEIVRVGRMIAYVADVRIYKFVVWNKDIYLLARLCVSNNSLSKKNKYKDQPVQIGGSITLEHMENARR